MNRHTFDAVVIGSGIAGASAAFHLSTAGLRVAVVGGNSGPDLVFDGFLGAYHRDQESAKLVLAARDEFVHWGNIVGGSTGFVRTGLLQSIESDKLDEVRAALQLLRDQNIKHQLLEAAELRMQFPSMKWSDHDHAVWEPVAGYGDPVRCTARYLARVAAAGGLVPEGALAFGLRARNSKLIGVDTSCGFIATETAVFAPSASDVNLIAGLTYPVTARSTVVQKFLVEPSAEGVPGVWEEVPETLWIRPEGPEHILVGAVGNELAPHEFDKPPSKVFLKSCRVRAEERLPHLTLTDPVEVRSRVEAHTPDGLPIIDQWPLVGGLYLSLAFGGLDFRIGPAIGKGIAEWVTSGRKPPLLVPLRMGRFKSWFDEEEKKRVKAASIAQKKAEAAARRAAQEEEAAAAAAAAAAEAEKAAQAPEVVDSKVETETPILQPAAVAPPGDQISSDNGKAAPSPEIVEEVVASGDGASELPASDASELAPSQAPRKRRRRRRRRKRVSEFDELQAPYARPGARSMWPFRPKRPAPAETDFGDGWPEITVHIPSRDPRLAAVADGGPANLRIRPMLPFDLEAMKNLVYEYIHFRNEPRPDPKGVDALLQHLQIDPTAGKIFVAVSGSNILGFAILYFTFSTFKAQRVAMLSDLYVRPSERGRGLGRTLCEVCLAFVKDNNFASLEWLAPPENGPVRALSEGFGGRAEASVYYSL